ncbi:hypothetical protein ACFQAV_08715 [Companilactobacillus huachuanensis]|uniref:Uncharacterized protein n=1 Tax=Companilactobacillus huachuanensis TaxID=2559914 RepID=A0ABW1RLC7_9LACO|nr:hypothetical protein [Companilactobacillus huachuanensis]
MEDKYKYQELKNFIRDNKESIKALSREGGKLPLDYLILDSDVEELALFIKKEIEQEKVGFEYVKKLITIYEYMASQVDNDGNSMFYDWSNGKEFRKDFH